MTKRFPKFESHAQVSCFNCEGNLDGSNWRESGFGPRRGQYAQDCRKCGMFTCYDVKEKAA